MKKQLSQQSCLLVSFSILSFLLLASDDANAAKPAVPAPVAAEDRALPEQRIAEGHILVQPYPGVSQEAFAESMKKHGASASHRLGNLPVWVVDIPPKSERAKTAELSHHKHVNFAEVDALIPATGTVVLNDPNYWSQWHLTKIQALDAWATAMGNGATIAILDTGVDSTHPDLMANIVPGWNVYSNNSDTSDVYGHGTSVAGTAAAIINNGIGGIGVSPQSKIMPIRISDASGYAYFSTMASGVNWAADHGAQVANISFENVNTSSAVITAAQYMQSKGGLVVTAAGNSGTDAGTANTPEIIAASASDSNDQIASFSNYGQVIDVAAPGVNILTTTNGGGYGWVSGTSFASPIVAGVVALVKSAKAGLAPATVRSVIFNSADDLGAAGYDIYYGYGRVNANRAVALAQTLTVDTTPPTVAIAAPANGASVAGSVTIAASAQDNVAVNYVNVYVNDVLLGVAKTSPYAVVWDTTRASNGAATIAAEAYDAAGNKSAKATVSVTVANPIVVDVTSPVATVVSPLNNSTVTTTNLAIQGRATDNIGVTKLYVAVDGKTICSTTNVTSISCNWNTKKASRGVHTLSVVANDAAGNVGASSVSVTK